MAENPNVLSALKFKADVYKLFPFSGLVVLAVMFMCYPYLLRDNIGRFQVAAVVAIWVAVPVFLWRHYEGRTIILTTKSICLKHHDRVIKQVACANITKIKTIYLKDRQLMIYESDTPSIGVGQANIEGKNEFLDMVLLLCEQVPPSAIVELDSLCSAYALARNMRQSIKLHDRANDVQDK